MTYIELVKRLAEICGLKKWSDFTPAVWRRDAMRIARKAIAANSDKQAAYILKKDGWGNPMTCAKILRRKP